MRGKPEKAAEETASGSWETASRMFRDDGFDGVGVDAIMTGAGSHTWRISTVISDRRTISPPRR